MQSKGAKILYWVLMGFSAVWVYWLHTHGFFAKPANDVQKEIYQNYVRTDATVISVGSTGGIKGARRVYTLQFKDNKGILRSTKIEPAIPTEITTGSIIYIYYNPEHPNVAITEVQYNDVMD